MTPRGDHIELWHKRVDWFVAIALDHRGFDEDGPRRRKTNLSAAANHLF